MKKMKQVVAGLLAVLIVMSMVACGNKKTESEGGNGNAESTEQPSKGSRAEIAMITDKGDINDKSFNQGTWEGIKAYADANGKECQYYRPVAATVDDYISMMEQSIRDGAKIVVAPGFLFAQPVYDLQDKYTDIKFVLVDEWPNDGNSENPTFKTADNATGIVFAEEEAGFLAGYAVVKDGYTKLGFMGGQAVPAVIRYGYGFIDGANKAAEELGVDIDMEYYYTGDFEATPEVQAMAASWYNNGTEVIFACGGPVGNSVMAAAEQAGAKVVGVDIDQSFESDTVITSATKDLSSVMAQVLGAYVEGKFPGGENQRVGTADNAVGLPMETSKFEKFNQEDYDTIYSELASGNITVVKDDDVSAPTEIKAPKVKLNFIVQ